MALPREKALRVYGLVPFEEWEKVADRTDEASVRARCCQ